MKKLFALLFVAALFLTQAEADELILAPGKTQTIRLDKAYYSSKHDDKSVAYTTGLRSRDVTIHAKHNGTSHVQLFAKDGSLIRAFDIEVGSKAAAAKKEIKQTVIPEKVSEITPVEEKSVEMPEEISEAAPVEKATEVEFEPSSARAKSHAKKMPVAAVPYDAFSPLRNLFPKESIVPQLVGNSVVIRGTVSDAATAAQIMKVAEQLTGGRPVINMLQVKGGQQVMLRVRIGEVQRGALDQLGLSAQGVVGAVSGLFYSSKMYDVSTRLDYLSRNGLMKVLAEPNLTAISGEKATFLAGGEFPIPVAQKGGADVFTVEYKPFGVGIAFTPTVYSQNRIRLEVEPEVSELHGAVKYNGSKIPMLSTRRAKTTVELAPGESFMIAGLISDDMRNVSDEMPGLGDIPVLGGLFRSTAFKHNETELVIAVTPYLVDPVPSKEIKLPTDDLKPAGILEQYFFGALAHKPSLFETTGSSSAPQLDGKHGFMTE